MLVTIVSSISVADAYADYGIVLDSTKITGNTVLTGNSTQTVAFEAGDRMGISVTNIEGGFLVVVQSQSFYSSGSLSPFSIWASEDLFWIV